MSQAFGRDLPAQARSGRGIFSSVLPQDAGFGHIL
jgi:hypothetical protein